MDPTFAFILVMLALGQLCARLRALPDDAPDTLNRFVIYVCFPALVLKHVPSLRWDPNLYVLVLVPWLSLLASAGLVMLYTKLTHVSREVRAALMLCVPLGNTSFLGFAMVSALLGEQAVQYAVVYDQLGSFLILSTYGITTLAVFSGEGRPTAGAIALRIAKFPPFITLCIALLPLPHYAWLTTTLTRLGDTLVPIAMFAVGMRLQLKPHALTQPRELLFGLGVKMGLTPLLMLGALHVLGAQGMPARVALLESAMPPMITAGALASMAGFAPELAAALVGYGVLLALVVLPPPSPPVSEEVEQAASARTKTRTDTLRMRQR